VREGLNEESLAVFDLLKKPDLSAAPVGLNSDCIYSFIIMWFALPLARLVKKNKPSS
jgi:hypothetical protein